jgi:hypothetical protein
MVEPMLFVAQAASRFDGEGELADAALAKFLSEVLAAFGSWVGLAGPALYRQSHQR